MPLDEFIHDVRDKGTWVSRFSAESIQVLARGSRPVALNNAQETIVEQSMSVIERGQKEIAVWWLSGGEEQTAIDPLPQPYHGQKSMLCCESGRYK